MATKGFSAMGSTLVFDGVTVGEVENWDGGEDTLENEKILTCDSTDYYPDVIAKAFDCGERRFTMIFQPDNTSGNYKQLKDKFDARTKGTLLLTYANTVSFSATALITSLARPSAPDAAGVQRFTIGFTLASKSAFTGTTS